MHSAYKNHKKKIYYGSYIFVIKIVYYIFIHVQNQDSRFVWKILTRASHRINHSEEISYWVKKLNQLLRYVYACARAYMYAS